MIRVRTKDGEITLTPTIFPDGTSQVWKVDPKILQSDEYLITWNFESEREIIDLYSFRTLLTKFNGSNPFITLHLPYLPYGRQDKEVGNESTFNLAVFAELINNLSFDRVTSVDTHNSAAAHTLISNFRNIEVDQVHRKLISLIEPTFIVFPDKGAMTRYGRNLSHIKTIFCDKIRDQATGQILGTTVNMGSNREFINRDRVLIIDDICDGGATFIGVAKALREMNEHLKIYLFVTHGIFSKGKQHLISNEIDEIYTTNSLLQNKDGFPV